jgi:hypothetical protein
MAGILESLLAPQAANKIAEQQGIAASSNPLLAEAAKTAGMFGRSLGGLLGTDMRTPEERKAAQVKAILDRAPGNTQQEKIANSVDALRQADILSPVELLELEKLQSQFQTQQRNTTVLQGVSQRLIDQGHDDLAALVSTGQLKPNEALTQARLRNEQKGSGGGGAYSVTGQALTTYRSAVAEDEDAQTKLESMAQREDPNWLSSASNALFGTEFEGDVSDTSVENLTQLAADRAEFLFRQNPRAGRAAAMKAAVNEMYGEFSQGKTPAEGEGTQPVPQQPRFTAEDISSARERLAAGERVRLPNKRGQMRLYEWDAQAGKLVEVKDDIDEDQVNPFAIQ